MAESLPTVQTVRATPARVLVAYLRLPHFAPVVVVLSASAAMALVLDRHAGGGRLVLLLLAMLGAQLVIGVVNELVDLPDDRRTKPDKPLVTGLVRVRGAVALLAVAFLLMVIAAWPLGGAAVALCLAGCGVGVAYSLWFKRSMLAWLPYLIALPLLPIYVASALRAYNSSLLWLYPLGLFAVAGVQLAQAVPDVAADRAAGIESITTRLGERRSMVACGLATAGSALLLAAAGRQHGVVIGAAGVVLLAVAGLGVLYAARREAGVAAAFPVAAVSTALLGVVWVYAAGR